MRDRGVWVIYAISMEVVVMLSDKLKNLRQQKGITQEEAAKQLNVVRQTLSKWEKGTSIPDANTLMKIAKLYGVGINELLDINDSQEEATQKSILETLTVLNEKIEIRNRRWKILWRIIMVIGIVIVLWGISGMIYGIVNYNMIVKDTTYSIELQSMLLEGIINVVILGAKRTIVGLVIAIASAIIGSKRSSK